MKHGSLFSGIGGFDLAAEWMGWENVFHCEWNEFGKRVLKYYWPNAISYNDITKTDFTIHRGAIDILTGGFPCQPYSVADKRKGKDDERHLWPEMLRAIREIQPRFVVGENVSGLISWNGGVVFEEVQADLENEGYEVFAFILPACSKDAPHRRDRVWIIAHSNLCRNDITSRTEKSVWKQSDCFQTGDRGAMQINGLGNEQSTTDTTNTGVEGLQQGWENGVHRFGAIANSDNQGFQGCAFNRASVERAPDRKQLFAGLLPPDWQEFPTQPPICNGNDGLSTELDGITFSKWRNETIKAGGNAIVPQIAFEIFKAIEQIDKAK